MTFLFWLFLFLILYCYFGYPFLLWLMAKGHSRPVRKAAYEPEVSVILSVWNEEDVIERKMKNFLSLEYPREKIEFLIGSDGSTDRTGQIIRRFADERIRLIERPQRLGKMATLNELVRNARHEIIVFCDARQEFAADALRELTANFSDAGVGCVSGELIFEEKKEAGSTARGVNLYWNYEKFIRRQESRLHSMLGATGAIYAIRRELFLPMPVNIVLDDMFVPLEIIRKGYRAVFDAAAKAYDAAADNPREEYRRKVRTLYGNWQIFGFFADLFHPFQSPVAVQLFSHKFLRLLVPFLLIILFLINAALSADAFYRRIFILQIVFYAAAGAGGLAKRQKCGIFKLIARLGYVPYVFCLLNFAALAGFVQFILGGQDVRWKKARE